MEIMGADDFVIEYFTRQKNKEEKGSITKSRFNFNCE